MQQTSYTRKYMQKNQQQFDNQRILTPPWMKMIPQHRTYKYVDTMENINKNNAKINTSRYTGSTIITFLGDLLNMA